jgi:hypothetical protein
VDISQLNHRLNMMSQMPNNNIGLALIFRRFSQMSVDEQKEYVSHPTPLTHLQCFNIFNEYNKHFTDVSAHIEMLAANITTGLDSLSAELQN